MFVSWLLSDDREHNRDQDALVFCLTWLGSEPSVCQWQETRASKTSVQISFQKGLYTSMDIVNRARDRGLDEAAIKCGLACYNKRSQYSL